MHPHTEQCRSRLRGVEISRNLLFLGSWNKVSVSAASKGDEMGGNAGGQVEMRTCT